MRTITVEGKGESVREPDWAVLEIEMSVLKEKFEDAVDLMNELVNKLRISLKEIGFDEDNLKTDIYNIRQDYNAVEKGLINKEYSRKFNGFKVSHDLKLEFDFDNEKLSQVLNRLNDYEEYLTFELNFSVKDKDGMKKEVLENASENARFKAEILANASSVKLGNLVKIDCRADDYYFKSYTTFEHIDMCTVNYMEAPNISPEKIKIRDTLIFVWEVI